MRPASPLPELRPGHWYEGLALDPDGREVLFEIAPHPDHPGFWVYSFTHNAEGGDCFADFLARGIRLDSFARAFASYGVAPQSWEEYPVEPGFRPLALELDDRDRAEGKGRYSWMKRAEAC